MLDTNYGLGGWEDDDIIEKIKLYKPKTKLYYTYGSFVYHMESLTMADTEKGKNWTKQNNNQKIFEKKMEKKKWIPPRYKFNTLAINVKTKNNYILNLTKKNINGQKLYEHQYNGIVINDYNNKNEICVVDKNDKIILKYRESYFILYKKKWEILEFYSIINTCINYL